MLQTYKAVLRGDRLEWRGDAPKLERPEQPVPVHVTLLDEPVAETVEPDRGRRVAEALEQLAEMHALADIEDPVDWEKDMREDRPLLNREA